MKTISNAIFICILINCHVGCKDNITNKNIEKDAAETEVSDEFYQYSIWYAFVNKVFGGELTVKELKNKGGIDLGSYTMLDEELVMLDGKPYQIKEDAAVYVLPDNEKIVYANAGFFREDYNFNINDSIGFDELRRRINENLPSKNMFNSFKIHGKFNWMKCGGLHKQELPFKDGLDVLIPNRPVFTRENFEGTIVGFYCPEFIGNINVSGYHLHFISDDRKFGEHIMGFEAETLQVSMDEMHEYKFVLPNTNAFRKVGFEKEFQYKKK